MDRGARWGTAVCGVAKSWTGLREFSLYKHLKEKKKRMTKKKMNFRQSKTLGCLFLKKKKKKKKERNFTFHKRTYRRLFPTCLNKSQEIPKVSQ